MILMILASCLHGGSSIGSFYRSTCDRVYHEVSYPSEKVAHVEVCAGIESPSSRKLVYYVSHTVPGKPGYRKTKLCAKEQGSVCEDEISQAMWRSR